jgi:hypothetical protein
MRPREILETLWSSGDMREQIDALEAALYALDREIKRTGNFNPKPLNPEEITAHCDKKHN